MELLQEIANEDVGISNKKVKYILRKTARAVLFHDGKIALLYVAKHKYHKIPGGGVEKGENIKQALEREILEETGCKAKIKQEIGKIIEYRDNFGLKQISHCFLADVAKKTNLTSFTRSEKSNGFELKWTTLSKAISVLAKDKPDNYEGKFIVKRDLAFLKKAEQMIK